MLFAHYDRTTGTISQITEARWPFEREGLGVAIIRDRAALASPHRVCLETVQMGDLGWDCAAVEPYTPPLTVADVKARRNAELTVTDAMMTPDRPTDKAAWADYRFVLRNLGACENVLQMIIAWPIRPDGMDAIADLRR